MRGLGWEGTLWCWAVSGEAYWLWAGSPYWIVRCIHPGNGHMEIGYTFADQARKHCLRCNTWLPKHPWYRPPLTDFSQNSGYLLHLVQVSKKKIHSRRRELQHFMHQLPLPTELPSSFLSTTRNYLFHWLLCHFPHCAKMLFRRQQSMNSWLNRMNMNALFTLDSHMPCPVVAIAGLPPWVEASTQLQCQYLVSFLS